MSKFHDAQGRVLRTMVICQNGMIADGLRRRLPAEVFKVISPIGSSMGERVCSVMISLPPEYINDPAYAARYDAWINESVRTCLAPGCQENIIYL